MIDRNQVINLSYCRHLRGRAFGITGRTLLVAISIDTKLHNYAEKLIKKLIEVDGVDHSAKTQSRESSIDRLRGVIVDITLTLAREARLPIFDDWKDTGHVLNIDGRAQKLLALPEARGHGVKLALETVINLVLGLTQTDDLTDEMRSAFMNSKKSLLDRLLPHAPAGVNAIHFMRAAHRMKLETHELPLAIVSYGSGKHARWLQSSATDRTSHLGTALAKSKSATRQLLQSAGLPVPYHHVAETIEGAVQIARKIGFPVVVKPDDQEQGRGVAAGLVTDDQVRDAFALAAKLSKKILVEKHHDGHDIRITVANGEIVKVFARESGGVFGDGKSTVKEILAIDQATPRAQRLRLQYGRYLLDLDDEAMALLNEQGLQTTSVPETGQFIRLRRKNNISSGGRQSLIEISKVHPDNLDLAIRAAQVLQLDIAGIDLITPDVSCSWTQNNAVIIEVNAKPQIGITLLPEAYEHILRLVVGPVGNIPVHLMLVINDAEPGLDAAINAMCHSMKLHGNASIRGINIENKPDMARFGSGFEACMAALGRRELESLLCVLSVEDVLEFGLPVASFQSFRVFAPRETGLSSRVRLALTMIRPHIEPSQARDKINGNDGLNIGGG